MVSVEVPLTYAILSNLNMKQSNRFWDSIKVYLIETYFDDMIQLLDPKQYPELCGDTSRSPKTSFFSLYPTRVTLESDDSICSRV